MDSAPNRWRYRGEKNGMPVPSRGVIDFFLAMDSDCEGTSPLDATGALLTHILTSMTVADVMIREFQAAIQRKRLSININPELTVEFAVVRQIPKMLSLLASKGQAFEVANRFMVEGDVDDPDFVTLPSRPIDASDFALWIGKRMELPAPMLQLLDLVRKRRAGILAKTLSQDIDLTTESGWYDAIYHYGFRNEDGSVNWDEMIGNIASAVVHDERVTDIEERYADFIRRVTEGGLDYGISATEAEAYGKFEREHLIEFCRLCDIPYEDFYTWLKEKLAMRANMDLEEYETASATLMREVCGEGAAGFVPVGPEFELLFRMSGFLRRANQVGGDVEIIMDGQAFMVNREGIRQNIITLLESAL